MIYDGIDDIYGTGVTIRLTDTQEFMRSRKGSGASDLQMDLKIRGLVSVYSHHRTLKGL